MRMIVGSILAIAALTSGVGAKGPATGEAWQVGRALTPGVCEANGAGTKDIRFALVVMGSDFELGLWEGKDLPKADGRYPVTLSLDDDAPVHMLASAKGGLFEISLGRGELMDAVVHAKEMTVSLAGHSYRLRLAGAAAALDRAARCAGKPTLAEEHELPPVPIPDGGAWGLYETLPTATGRVCIPAIKDGEVSTTFLHDKPDRLFLIWKNMKWDFPAQTFDLHMSIDGGPDIVVPAHTERVLLSVMITDAVLIQRLRQAETLSVASPLGPLKTNIRGLGAALDAVERCRKS